MRRLPTRETEAWRDWPTPEPGTSLRKFHDGRCGWCGYEDRLVRDHCHNTGLIRGLLCYSCNQQESNDWHGVWGPWRAGENTARAVGQFEIYSGFYGTPLHPTSALNHYTDAERDAWWDQTVASLAAGGDWPTEAPWSELATARRDADLAEMRAAIDRLPFFGGGAA